MSARHLIGHPLASALSPPDRAGARGAQDFTAYDAELETARRAAAGRFLETHLPDWPGWRVLQTFRRAGHEVTAADTLAAGAWALADERPDVLATDVMLPDGDGIDRVAGSAQH